MSMDRQRLGFAMRRRIYMNIGSAGRAREFVGCNLPVPITVRRTVADPVRGSGRGPDPPPSGLWLFFITCLTQSLRLPLNVSMILIIAYFRIISYWKF